MPQFLHGPEFTGLTSELLPSHLAAALSILSALPSPADRPALGHVLHVASACCRQAIAHMPVITPVVAQLGRSFEAIAATIADMPAIEGAVLMRGQTTRFPAWNCFASMALDSPSEAMQLAGAELLNAITLRGQFRKDIADQIAELLFRDVVEDRQKALASMKVRARKLLGDVAASAGASKQDSSLLALGARIKASLAEQLDAPNLDDRQGCGSARELSHSETCEAAAILKRKILEGDAVALVIAIAFCCGPTWDTVIEFPFEEYAGDDWVARIDARAGIVQIDLTTLLELAPAKPGHEPASPVLVIHLPQFIADALCTAIASDPAARCPKELVALDGLTSRNVLPGMPEEAPLRATIARFIRTRATAAIRAGVDRGVAAYACADLAKVGKSSHSYFTYELAEIWEGNARRYAAIGWGAPVARSGGVEMGVGSMATPTVETIQRIDRRFVERAEQSRAGRRYTWTSLVGHHNSYVQLCAHRTALFTLARQAAQFEFYADTVHEAFASCLLIDKRVGPFEGATPLPMSNRFAMQLRLWKSHLRSFDARIERLRPAGWQRISRRIDAILEGKHVPLFFLIDEDGGLKDFGSEELLAQHPDIPLKADGRRHFMVNALRKQGVPFSFASAQLRHHIDGLALTDLCSEVPMLLAMERLAQGLDRIAFDLGIHPVAGLSRGKEGGHGRAR